VQYVEWDFTVRDNLTPAINRQAQATEGLTASERQAGMAVGDTKRQVDSQNISFLAQTQAVRSLYSGFGVTTRSMYELGMVSDATAAKLQKTHQVLGLVYGGYNLLKGASQVIRLLTQAETSLAIVQTYRNVINSPWKAALVGVGIGAAVGAGAALASTQNRGSGGSTTNNNSITFNAPMSAQSSRGAARDSFESLGA
jgi:hypothetical protein